MVGKKNELKASTQKAKCTCTADINHKQEEYSEKDKLHSSIIQN
jgi:hypothetical protein